MTTSPTSRPSAPADLDRIVADGIARVWRRWFLGLAFIWVVPVLIVGGSLAQGLADGDAVWVVLWLAVPAVPTVVYTIVLRRRYGPRGQRWAQQLGDAAVAASGPAEVDVWFVRPDSETPLSTWSALIAPRGGRPCLVATLLPLGGSMPTPGPAFAWGDLSRGKPILLERDGQPLWPARPAGGRLAVAATRFQAGTMLMPLDRPPDTSAG